MCGFVGFWDFTQTNSLDLSATATKMADQIAHRGPDSRGVWCDSESSLVMAHQRLAIRDLSSQGAQPMRSACGRWVIVYNGEIYNCDELTDKKIGDLEHVNDTTILLEAISRWGLEKTLSKINGMFAFSLWDKKNKSLFLVRDRMGIKPLYFGFNHDILYFGSQLKTFKAHPRFKPTINQRALASYFRVNFIGAPQTIYEKIYKLKPGFYVEIDSKKQVKEKQYWSLLNKHSRINVEKNSQEQIHQLLKDAVKKRMVADVPLGAFLSGGIDSSLVVSLMQAQSMQKVKTFSIGFNEAEFNEAIYAKQVAKHLNTDHHELYFSNQDAIDLIPTLTKWYDEPFADSSQLPTLLVSKLAKQHVTVSLSGDGGDELFAGYTRYFTAYNFYKKLSLLPPKMRSTLGRGIQAISPANWDRFAKCVPNKLRPSQVGDKAHKFANILKNGADDFYMSLISLWQQPSSLLSQPVEEYEWLEINDSNFVRKMQLLDALTYLPEDILTKVDRASMAHSLEARVPLLDYRVVEGAFQLPQKSLIQKNKGKLILRNILNEYVPQQLIDRPKMGFGVPIGQWLRGSLRDWAESLLSTQKLEHTGLNPEVVRLKWQQHLAGNRNWQYPLWGVLMYQLWHENS